MENFLFLHGKVYSFGVIAVMDENRGFSERSRKRVKAVNDRKWQLKFNLMI
jgi:chromosome condensin MukBEF complex kleisin-like MukF subunit